MSALGVYVHVPFCRERCDYCAFATYTDRDHLMERYADACILDVRRVFTDGDLPAPTSPYGVTKLCAEQLVMAYRRSLGLDARSVRYFTVYGPRQRPDMAFSRLIGQALSDLPFQVFGDGPHLAVPLCQEHHDAVGLAQAVAA